MMLLACCVVLLRYGFNIGSIALQEAVTYCHAFIFLLGAAFTLQQDAHVRVDIFYQRFSAEQKAWINALGCLTLLLPFCIFLLLSSWQFFDNARVISEGSADPGGLPFLYLFKGFLPLSMLLLLLQAGVIFCKHCHVLLFSSSCETSA